MNIKKNVEKAGLQADYLKLIEEANEFEQSQVGGTVLNTCVFWTRYWTWK